MSWLFNPPTVSLQPPEERSKQRSWWTNIRKVRSCRADDSKVRGKKFPLGDFARPVVGSGSYVNDKRAWSGSLGFIIETLSGCLNDCVKTVVVVLVR